MRHPLRAAALATTLLVSVLVSSACEAATPWVAPAVTVTSTAPASAVAKPVELKIAAPPTLPGYSNSGGGDTGLDALWIREALQAAAPRNTGYAQGTYKDTKTGTLLSLAVVAVKDGSLQLLVKAFDLVEEGNQLKGTKVTLDKPSVPTEGCAQATSKHNVKMYICSWIDGETMGILAWMYGPKPSDGKAQLAQIRQILVTRS